MILSLSISISEGLFWGWGRDPDLPDQPYSQECGPTMCSLSPLVTLTSPSAPRTPLLRPPESHSYLFATRFVTPLLQVSQEVLPTSSLRYLLQKNIHLQPYSAPKNVSRESLISSSAQRALRLSDLSRSQRFSKRNKIAFSSFSSKTTTPLEYLPPPNNSNPNVIYTTNTKYLIPRPNYFQ